MSSFGAPNSETPEVTSASLLAGAAEQDPEAWSRVCAIYGPVVYNWIRQAGLQSSDAADVAQEVFQVVASRLSAFRRDRPGDSFRGWLYGITRNKLKEYVRRQMANPQGAGGTNAHASLQRIADLDDEESAVSQAGSSGIMRPTMDAIRAEFTPKTWQAFWRSVVEEHRTADIAADLQMTRTAVRQAKHRVISRLRRELSEFS